MEDGYGSRKFVLAIAGLLLSCVLVWFSKISGTEFVTLNSILGGAYMYANVKEVAARGLLNVK